MNKTRTTPIGEFTAQIDPVLGKNIEAYLGIPKAAMERNLRQSEVLQNDWIAFMKTGALPGGEAFAVSEQIRIYDGTGFEDRLFPQKDEIRDVYDSDLFERLRKDFMRGRDAGYIA